MSEVILSLLTANNAITEKMISHINSGGLHTDMKYMYLYDAKINIDAAIANYNSYLKQFRTKDGDK